jgi:hypothetical protein
VPARAAHRPTGEDGLLPGRVVLRPRAPASGDALLRARHDGRGAAGLALRARLRRRRGVHVEFSRRGGERGDARGRALRGAQRGDRRVRRVYQQPAVRGDARFRRGPGLLRLRGADGQVCPPGRPGPGRVPDPQCHV